MHRTRRGIAAALFVAVLLTALPLAAAAPRPSPRPNRIVQAARRLVDTLVPWIYSRLSPPGGTPTEDETPTTEPTTDPKKSTS